jgi:hypothetical protein
VEPPNHSERQGAVAAQDFVHARPAADDSHQRLGVRALLLQAKLDGVDWGYYDLAIVKMWRLLPKHFGRCGRGLGVLNDRVGFYFQ